MRLVLVVALLLLAGCATAPRETRNACAIFEQRDGLFNNWRRAAESTQREYGVPVAVLMATIYTESGFRPYARPPRRKLLGFIPWKHQSSAYGYSQAIDGTWARYQRQTGRWSARRTKFSDAIRFIGWYHAESRRRNGIALNDTYNLYLAYYFGHTAYSRGDWRAGPGIRRAARRTANMAVNYWQQLRRCPN